MFPIDWSWQRPLVELISSLTAWTSRHYKCALNSERHRLPALWAGVIWYVSCRHSKHLITSRVEIFSIATIYRLETLTMEIGKRMFAPLYSQQFHSVWTASNRTSQHCFTLRNVIMSNRPPYLTQVVFFLQDPWVKCYSNHVITFFLSSVLPFFFLFFLVSTYD